MSFDLSKGDNGGGVGVTELKQHSMEPQDKSTAILEVILNMVFLLKRLRMPTKWEASDESCHFYPSRCLQGLPQSLSRIKGR